MPNNAGVPLASTAWIGLVALIALGVVPFAGSPYIVFVCGQMLGLAYLSISLQLSFSYARILSFAQGTFFALGAYSAFYFHRAGLDLLTALTSASLVSGLAGSIIGLMVTRMKAAHTAVIGTLLIASIAHMSSNSLFAVTGGEDGVSMEGATRLLGVLVPLGVTTQTYLAAFVPLSLYLLFVACADRTTFGAVLKAVGQNEGRALQLGFNVQRRQLVIFTIATMVAGYGGAISAFMLQHVSTSLFDPNMSLTAVLWATVGGLGTPFGALIGTIVVFPLTELASRFFQYVDIAVGLLLIVTALYFPDGISGSIDKRLIGGGGSFSRLRGRRGAATNIKS